MACRPNIDIYILSNFQRITCDWSINWILYQVQPLYPYTQLYTTLRRGKRMVDTYLLQIVLCLLLKSPEAYGISGVGCDPWHGLQREVPETPGSNQDTQHPKQVVQDARSHVIPSLHWIHHSFASTEAPHPSSKMVTAAHKVLSRERERIDEEHGDKQHAEEVLGEVRRSPPSSHHRSLHEVGCQEGRLVVVVVVVGCRANTVSRRWRASLSAKEILVLYRRGDRWECDELQVLPRQKIIPVMTTLATMSARLHSKLVYNERVEALKTS